MIDPVSSFQMWLGLFVVILLVITIILLRKDRNYQMASCFARAFVWIVAATFFSGLLYDFFIQIGNFAVQGELRRQGPPEYLWGVIGMVISGTLASLMMLFRHYKEMQELKNEVKKLRIMQANTGVS